MSFTENHPGYDFNTLAEKTWECPVKGLRKELLEFKFTSMSKATEISRCLVEITNVQELKDRNSNYLNHKESFWIDLGTGLTPIDIYVEILLQRMFIGETSKCFIKTKSGEEINFIIKLLKIDLNNYLFKLTPPEMLKLAIKYKENGVLMFKKYPIFAQYYFCKAAKCLISFKPFDVLDEHADGVNPVELEKVFNTIQINIAACLIKQKRFDDVLYLTQNINDGADVFEKAIYRRAVAFYNLKKFEEAKETLARVDFKKNKEFLSLYNNIVADLRKENEQINKMVKKMFG